MFADDTVIWFNARKEKNGKTKKDMKLVGVTEEDTKKTVRWKQVIYCCEP